MLYFLLVILIVLFAGMIFLIITGWGRTKGVKDGRLFVTRTNEGEIRISEKALEDIIEHIIKDTAGLGRWRTVISNEDNYLDITIYCEFDDEFIQEQLVPALQERIRVLTHDYSGLPVKEVKVLMQSNNKEQIALKK